MPSAPDKAQLGEDAFIRAKLFSSDKSQIRRYADLVVGEEAGYGELFLYEATTSLLGSLPGALGIALRKLFYPRLFKRCGRGVIFGRGLVIRNARSIALGDNVVLDDGVVIDGRGAGPEGVVIGDRCIIGRGVMMQAKIGPVHIGADSDIGSSSVVHSQGGTFIGKEVVLGGGAKISGGVFQIDLGSGAGGQAARAQQRFTNGPIRINDRCLIGMGCLFLDGVEVGEGCVIGAGSLVSRSLPAWGVAAGSPAKVRRMRDGGPIPAEPYKGETT